MSREIKFRAWDNGQMIYSYEWKESIEQERDNDYATLSSFFSAIREDAIGMQFTGLHDKNGKEIYEGDILKFAEKEKGYPAYAEVQWSDENACFHMKFNEEYFSLQFEGCEVAGNIYENPELLNKE